MRAAMLGGEEIVGRVVVAARRHAVGHLLEPERLGRRPEDRRLVVGVREIDELAGGKRGVEGGLRTASREQHHGKSGCREDVVSGFSRTRLVRVKADTTNP